MKRKRSSVNRKPLKSAVLGSNEAVSNANDKTGLVDLVKSTLESRKETKTPRTDSSMSGWKEDTSSLRQLVKSIITDLAKGITAETSRGFSSAVSPSGSSSFLRPPGEELPKENSRIGQQGPRYKKQELEAALLVLKKTMKLDAAKPFNVPVDPIALGIPDYFDVIEKPMDFGTICNNLENGSKYLNSEDVYNDVALIWHNCCKYNSKGGYILELLNQVKSTFMKNWTAAGLYTGQQQPVDEPSNSRHRRQGKTLSVLPAVDTPTRSGLKQVDEDQPLQTNLENQQKINSCELQPSPQQGDSRINSPEPSNLKRKRRGKTHSVVPVAITPSCLPQEAGLEQVDDDQPLPINLKKQHEKSSRELQPSPQQGDAHVDSPEPSNLRRQKRGKVHSVIPVTKTPAQLQQEAGLKQVDRDQSLPINLENHQERNSSELQPSHKQGDAHIDPPEPSNLRRGRRGKALSLVPGTDTSARLPQGAGFKQVDDGQALPTNLENQQERNSRELQRSSQQGDTPIDTPEPSNLRRTRRAKAHSVPLTGTPARLQQEAGLKLVYEDQPLPINLENQQENDSCELQPSKRGACRDSSDSTRIQNNRPPRGPSRGAKLLKLKERLVVTTNELGQPVGPEAGKLTRYLGVIARDGNMAPQNYPTWANIPEEKKEAMWQEVLSKFEIEPSCRKWILKSIGLKWGSFRFNLKANHYDTHETDAERLADRDERVHPDQWSYLITRWGSEKFKQWSAINKTNVSKVKFTYAAGSKSLAQIREEERAKKPDGKEPSRSELFIKTRTRKNGEPVNEATAAIISQLRESTANQAENLDDGASQDEVLTRVMGPERKVGVRQSYADAMKMASEANKEVHEIKKKVVNMEQTCAQMSAQMSAMMAMMASMQKSSPGQHVPDIPCILNDPGGSQKKLEPASTSEHILPSRKTRGGKKRS